MNPLISIVIPTTQASGTLSETLESVKKQTSQRFLCFVVDDSTRALPPAELAHFFDQDNFQWLQREGKPGGNCARNTGLSHVESDFVMFLDDDDLLIPNSISSRIASLSEPSSKPFDFLVFSNGIFSKTIGDTNLYHCFPEETQFSDMERFLLMDQPWVTSGLLWRREFIEKIGKWRPSLAAWQDWDINVRSMCAQPHYQRVFITDSYWRKDHRQRISIGRSPLNDEKLVGIETMVRENLATIMESTPVDQSFIYACWNILARFFLRKGDKRKAQRIFKSEESNCLESNFLRSLYSFLLVKYYRGTIARKSKSVERRLLKGRGSFASHWEFTRVLARTR